ncbi:MAG: type III-B CRISPR module RAMP protein Cmr4 [Desulfobacterales bacterium]
MYKQENSEIMALYGISPVHAGSGTSMGVVDLPIQRERHTNWPHIQASGVKGAMRHHFEKFKSILSGANEKATNEKITEKIFGTDDYDNQGTLPGAISVSDAKLLAFPMRSSKAPFVWITCPAVLTRLQKDLNLTGSSMSFDIPLVGEGEGIAIHGDMKSGELILLEDYEVKITEGAVGNLSGTAARLFNKAERLILVNDLTFHYGVSHCTEIRAQIKIDEKTGTTDGGSLRYEELLPADVLMYVIMFYGPSRDMESSIQAETLVSYMKEEVIANCLQIGGNETLGCGLFQVEWIKGGQNEQ